MLRLPTANQRPTVTGRRTTFGGGWHRDVTPNESEDRRDEPDLPGESSAAIRARAVQIARFHGRTIADLDGADNIGAAQVAEAIQYRGLDRAFP